MPSDYITKKQSRQSVPDLLAGAQWVALAHELRLSKRECDILKCIFSDERISAMSLELGLAEGTVHTYRERLFRKLGVRSCAQVIAVAFSTYLQLNSEISRRTTRLR